MSSSFGLSIHFLAPLFHGQRDGGLPEWPPSPLMALQALVAAASAQQRGHRLSEAAWAALDWLEQRPAPSVVAPVAVAGTGYRLSVPNNAMDIVARAWTRGNDSNSGDANPATHRTMKSVVPMWMVGGDTVHYLWRLSGPIADDVRSNIATLCTAARSIVALGWGIDMAVAHGGLLSDEEVAKLAGERWLPVEGDDSNPLRVPRAGSLKDLMRRHEGFLNRLHEDDAGRVTFAAPPPLSAFDVIGYRRSTDPLPRPAVAFSILKLDGSKFRSFDTTGKALTVAGMIRHATKEAANASGRPSSWANAFVLGHGEPPGAPQHKAVGSARFAYLPLPTIEHRGNGGSLHVGSVRRALLTVAAPGHDDEIDWASMALSGQQLVDERTRQPIALLRLLPKSDSVLRRYARPASTWTTVTPVVLPGFDDPEHLRRRIRNGTPAEIQKRLLRRLEARVDALLRKAIVQAGLPSTLADHASLDWRKVGFLPGTEHADRYGVPSHLRRFPRLHVRVVWRDTRGEPIDVPGPLCLGGGRHFGLGLFVAVPSPATVSTP